MTIQAGAAATFSGRQEGALVQSVLEQIARR